MAVPLSTSAKYPCISFSMNPQCCGEILFVAQHHVDQTCESLVDPSGGILATLATPQGVAIVHGLGGFLEPSDLTVYPSENTGSRIVIEV